MLILLPPSEKKSTQPGAAITVYTGVLYKALGWETLDKESQSRGQKSIAIISAKYGVLKPLDEIEPYKEKIDNKLWRDSIAQVAAKYSDELIIDCRSSTYKSVWPINPANTVEVRIFQVVAGERKVITHMSKKYRGELTRHLLTQATDPITPAEVQRMAAQLFECELHPPADAQPWALDLLIS